MKKLSLLSLSILLGLMSFPQTGIGTTTPDASAKLDVSATNKGFLPPRVTLTSVTDNTTISNPATGLLIYNTGNNVGLAAGYYYWNGTSWATIATASGSGVSASILRGSRSSGQTTGIAAGGTVVFTQVDNVAGQEMSLNTSSGQITLAAGRTYRLLAQVPNFQTSNSDSRPQFAWYNETTGAYFGSSSASYSAGSTAGWGATGGLSEAIITTTVSTVISYRIVNPFNVSQLGGSGDFSLTGSYPWFEAQVISGNTAVNGQSVDYVIARYTGADGSAIADNAIVSFDATASGNLTWGGNKFTLKANKTYELESSLAIFISGSSAGVAGRFQIYDYTNSVALANGLFMSQNGAGTNGQSANSPMKGIITPVTDIQVGIRLLDHYGPNGPSIVGNAVTTGVQSAPNASYFMVKQIGSSAIVNPWTLAGTNTYNTTGNVGIGTASPSASALLDLTSNSQGLLPPRVALTAKSGTSSPITSPTTGLIVYNTASAGTGGDAVTPGYYYYNGTIWTRMDPEGWSTGVPITIGAITTAPTKGTTTTASGGMDYVRYRNIGGKEYEVEYNILFTSGGTAGSGDYLFTLPGGLQFDFTAPGQIAYTGVSGYNAMKYRLSSAFGDLIVSGFHSSSEAIPYNATQFRIMNNNWGNNTWLMHGPSNYAMSDGTFGMKMTFKFKAL